MNDRIDVENLIDSLNPQLDFDLRKEEVKSCVFRGRGFTVDELLDIYNENDLMN